MIYKFSIVFLFCSSLLFCQQEITSDKLKENFAWQIALESKMFSTGLLDGVWGPKSDLALKEFLQAEGLGHITTPKNSEVVRNLLKVDFENVYTTYEITQEDANQLVSIPEDWNQRALLPSMGFEELFEVVQNKFRCSKKALARLNPNILPENYSVGTQLVVPLVREPAQKRISSLEIDLSNKIISGFNESGKKILFMYCSVAKNREKFPGRNATVANKALNPNYTFNPKYWPEVSNVSKVLIIKPGPKNPVGMAWVGLDLPGYGIHGTPIPDNIGKTGSHGCFRLTNWHAVYLLYCVNVGTPVIMKQDNMSEEVIAPRAVDLSPSSEETTVPQEVENK